MSTSELAVSYATLILADADVAATVSLPEIPDGETWADTDIQR